jgi:hypothetical protein
LLHPFTVLLYLLSLHSWNGFNRYQFCIYIHVYTFFAPSSLSYPFPTTYFLLLVPTFPLGKEEKRCSGALCFQPTSTLVLQFT